MSEPKRIQVVVEHTVAVCGDCGNEVEHLCAAREIPRTVWGRDPRCVRCGSANVEFVPREVTADYSVATFPEGVDGADLAPPPRVRRLAPESAPAPEPRPPREKRLR